MLLKNVQVGEVYLMIPWGDARMPEGRRAFGPEPTAAWADLAERGVPVEALEVGVDLSGYKRPGVRVHRLDRDTLQPVDRGHRWGGGYSEGDAGKPAIDEVMATRILGLWSEFFAAYHEYLDELGEAEERRRTERQREQAAAQEREAKRWMKQEFDRAKKDIEQVMTIMGDVDPASAFDDDDVKKLVEHRHPDGNPYLNGTYKA